MSARRAEHQTVIAGTPQQCFDALIDYAAIVEWQSAVKTCEVREVDSAGRGKHVFWELDAKVKSVSYTLAYTYEEPSWISYKLVEGDVSDIQGEYTFENRDDETTLATFSLKIDPGIWVPGKVVELLSGQVMKSSLDELKTHVEAVQ